MKIISGIDSEKMKEDLLKIIEKGHILEYRIDPEKVNIETKELAYSINSLHVEYNGKFHVYISARMDPKELEKLFE